MQTSPLFNRPDTMLGVCEGLGQDLGFNPFFARITFAVMFLFSPVLVTAAYVALGVVVLGTRWLFPTRPQTSAEGQVAPPAAADNDEVRLPLAA